MSSRPFTGVLAIAVASSLALAGCTSADTTDTTKPVATTSASTTPTKKPTKAPKFLPEGSAKDNLYYFTWTMEQALAADSAIDATTMAQKLADSGFGTAGVQFTLDRTAVGLASDSMFIGVPFAGECLVGQYGPKHSGVDAAVQPALASGGCLLGSGIQTLG